MYFNVFMKQSACQYEIRVIYNFHFYFSIVQIEVYIILEGENLMF